MAPQPPRGPLDKHVSLVGSSDHSDRSWIQMAAKLAILVGWQTGLVVTARCCLGAGLAGLSAELAGLGAGLAGLGAGLAGLGAGLAARLACRTGVEPLRCWA